MTVNGWGKNDNHFIISRQRSSQISLPFQDYYFFNAALKETGIVKQKKKNPVKDLDRVKTGIYFFIMYIWMINVNFDKLVIC